VDVPVGEAHRVGYEVVIKKIESYRVTHKGVKPVTPSKRRKPEARHWNPFSRAWGVICSAGTLRKRGSGIYRSILLRAQA